MSNWNTTQLKSLKLLRKQNNILVTYESITTLLSKNVLFFFFLIFEKEKVYCKINITTGYSAITNKDY